MKIKSLVGGLTMGVLALAFLALAAPASAQTGGVKGRIVDEAGKPIVDVVIVFSSPDLGTNTLKTNAKGEFTNIGMRPGMYSVKATKGDMSDGMKAFHVEIGSPSDLGTLTLRKNGDSDAAARKAQAAVEAQFKAAQATADAGNYDEAVAEFTKVAAGAKKCVLCYIGIGDTYAKKGDLAAAEAAYKQAIDLDPTQSEGYSALAAFYNTQKRFDDAAKISAKGTEATTASGGATKPVDVFNQAIIQWNSRNIPEAQALFLKVTELDPKMADAFYFLGMSYVNQGKMAEAKKPFDTYMSLAPTGQYADQVKGLLPLLK